jgi:hypothetical protein
VLTASAGFSDLEQLNRFALGNVTLHHKQSFTLARLISVYGSSFALQGALLTADLQEEALQVALGTEAEAAVDRFVRQLVTYDRLSTAGVDPLWTAVTGYYAGFFAANALMLACGRGLLRVNTTVISVAQTGGLHRVRLGQGSAPNDINLTLTPVAGPGSHQATWASVRELLMDLAATVGNGPHEAQTFASLAGLIVHPRWVSTERNEINYDLERNPFLAGFWSRELPSLTGENALESRILSATSLRPEQRFELVMTGCASLFGGLSREFLRRGGKVDPQRRGWRRAAMASCPDLQWLLA